MDTLTLFGLVAVSLMLLCHSLEDRSPWFVLAFAGSCGLGSVYGFVQGAWPLGLGVLVWAMVAVSRWLRLRREQVGKYRLQSLRGLTN
ncbi:MAG: hypothetical protein KKF77_12235 [Proteobacteria bacterium]|nr:hypothetical protein [Pseudomonadota bacterium]